MNKCVFLFFHHLHPSSQHAASYVLDWGFLRGFVEASSDRHVREGERANFDALAQDALDHACRVASICIVGRRPSEIKASLKEWWGLVGSELLLGHEQTADDAQDEFYGC